MRKAIGICDTKAKRRVDRVWSKPLHVDRSQYSHRHYVAGASMPSRAMESIRKHLRRINVTSAIVDRLAWRLRLCEEVLRDREANLNPRFLECTLK